LTVWKPNSHIVRRGGGAVGPWAVWAAAELEVSVFTEGAQRDGHRPRPRSKYDTTLVCHNTTTTRSVVLTHFPIVQRVVLHSL